MEVVIQKHVISSFKESVLSLLFSRELACTKTLLLLESGFVIYKNFKSFCRNQYAAIIKRF